MLGCLIGQVLLYLLLDLLFLYKLRVGILQLSVQSAVFIWTRLPDRTLSTVLPKQSLNITMQTHTVRHYASAAALHPHRYLDGHYYNLQDHLGPALPLAWPPGISFGSYLLNERTDHLGSGEIPVCSFCPPRQTLDSTSSPSFPSWQIKSVSQQPIRSIQSSDSPQPIT